MRLRTFMSRKHELRLAPNVPLSTPYRFALHSITLYSYFLAISSITHRTHDPITFLECDSGHPTKNGPSHSVLDRYLIIQSPLDANTRLLNSYEDRQNACFPSHPPNLFVSSCPECGLLSLFTGLRLRKSHSTR